MPIAINTFGEIKITHRLLRINPALLFDKTGLLLMEGEIFFIKTPAISWSEPDMGTMVEKESAEVNKPFVPPIDFSKATVTSFFMEERIVFGKADVHSAWDLAAGNKTPVKAVCDGDVIQVSFKYSENVTDKNGGGGNQIKIKCEVDEDVTYTVWYAHLYPGTAKVKENDKVTVGQEIAGVGTTGYSTGPHLHFQVQYNGNNVDGMSLIDFSDKTPTFRPPYGGFDNNPYQPINPNFPH